MDKILKDALEKETSRQNNNIELIASENYVSKDILNLQGSVLTNKYAEGYPNKRYYGGCDYIDVFEEKAIEYAKELGIDIVQIDDGWQKGITARKSRP